jgi:hypothetical protein
MTQKERQEQIQRLVAALEGDMTAFMIDEAGEVSSAPVDTTERRSCVLCNAYLDDDEPVIEGYDVCDDCEPELRELLPRQVVCLMCHGKRLSFHPIDHLWYDCEMCHGQGWINGVVARWNDAI